MKNKGKQNGKSQFSGILIVLIAASLFSTLGVLANIAHKQGVSPVAFGAWRETFGALSIILLLIFGLGRRERTERVPLSKIPRSEIRNLCIAAIAFMTYSLAIFYAFVHLSVALAYLLFYINPAIVTVIGAITGRELLTKPKFIALMFALGGSTLAIVGQMFDEGVRFNWLGVALALLAAVGMSVYILVGKSGYPSVPTTYATTIFLTAGAIVFALIGFTFGEKESLLKPFHDATLWPLLLFAGIIAAAIPTMMLLTGIRMLGASRSSMLQIFEPVAGSVLAAIFLSQQLYFIQMVGGALILFAAYILQRTSETSLENIDDLSNSTLINSK